MSPVSPVLHTVVTVSIVLKSAVRTFNSCVFDLFLDKIELGPANGNQGRSLMRQPLTESLKPSVTKASFRGLFQTNFLVT